MCLPFSLNVTPSKSNDAFIKTSHLWREMSPPSPRLIFAVMTMETPSHLADVFGIEAFPALVYLPEIQSIHPLSEEERDLRVLEVNNALLSESTIRLFVERNTGVKVN